MRSVWFVGVVALSLVAGLVVVGCGAAEPEGVPVEESAAEQVVSESADFVRSLQEGRACVIVGSGGRRHVGTCLTGQRCREHGGYGYYDCGGGLTCCLW